MIKDIERERGERGIFIFYFTCSIILDESIASEYKKQRKGRC